MFDSEGHAAHADEAGGLVGKNWGKVYEGYFERTDIADHVAIACDEILDEIPRDRTVQILEIGSGTGTVGERLSKHLEDSGVNPRLIIADKIRAQVEANENPGTAKAVFDNKKMPLRDECVDMVVARSVTHYEPTLEQEELVIDEVKRILRAGGFFVDQAVTMATDEEANLIVNIHLLVNKPMDIQSKEKVTEMLSQTFDEIKVSSDLPPALHSGTKGFLDRYNIRPEEAGELVRKIRQLIESVPEELRPNFHTTTDGFEYDVPYTIYLCRKGNKARQERAQ